MCFPSFTFLLLGHDPFPVKKPELALSGDRCYVAEFGAVGAACGSVVPARCGVAGDLGFESESEKPGAPKSILFGKSQKVVRDKLQQMAFSRFSVLATARAKH